MHLKWGVEIISLHVACTYVAVGGQGWGVRIGVVHGSVIS